MEKIKKNALSTIELLISGVIISLLIGLSINRFYPVNEEVEIIKMQSDLRQVKGVAANAILVKNQE